MKILYVDIDKGIVDFISKEYREANNQIFILDNYLDVYKFLENTKDIDLIITEIDFPNLDTFTYLEKIRTLNENLKIVITSEIDLEISLSKVEFLNIYKFLKKPFELAILKELITNICEITKQKKFNEQIIRLENQYSSLKMVNDELNAILKPFKEFSYYSETDTQGVITDISDSYCDLVGYKKNEIIGKKHSILKHPLEDQNKYKELWNNLTSGKSWIGELRCKDKSNNDVWYKTIIFPRKNSEGKIIGYAAKRQDITDRKYVELLSITNDLTGLYNKRFFKQTFLNEKNRVKRDNKNLVFLMIDVDYFKKYNDTYGHLKGDNVLKEVANVLKSFTKRGSDFAFRLGGEEFAIITSNLHRDQVLAYAENIRKAIENLQVANKNSKFKYLTISIGGYILEPDKDYSYEEIYNFADESLYESKASGRNKVSIYK